MDIPADNTLKHQTEHLVRLLAPLHATPPSAGMHIPPLLTAALFDFYICTVEQHHHESAGEIARSLASLLHHCGNRAPDEQERLQVSVLAESLLQALSPHIALDAYRPLVTPIAPTQAAGNSRIALHIDSATVRQMLHEVLAQAGFDPVNIDSLDALAQVDESTRPAAVIADLQLCQMHPQAADVFAGLRRRFSPPPHLFCVAPAHDIPARLEAVRLGATRFFGDPVDTARLVAVLRGVTAQVPRVPFRVLMVDDDPMLGRLYGDVLNDAGIDTHVLDDPLAVPAAVAGFEPDVIVTDIFMPGCNGFELLALLRQDDSLADTPIVLLSSEQETERRMEALNLGADDYLSKPVDAEVLIATVVARAKRARMLKRSRSEYRRVLQRVHELERSGPGVAAGGEVELQPLFTETINMDDYVVDEIQLDEKKSGGLKPV